MKKDQVKELTLKTIGHYSNNSSDYWEGTKDHDVLQNITALLKSIPGDGPHKVLDFGCGPGRDLQRFKDLGHEASGLDGCENFCKMATEYSGCHVYHQNFLETDLPELHFDGIFANASLFHMPKQELPNLISAFHKCLKSNGVLFSSNPRGDRENFEGTRYGNFMELEEYQEIVQAKGFKLVDHYYRPQDLPKEKAPWLACVFVKV